MEAGIPPKYHIYNSNGNYFATEEGQSEIAFKGILIYIRAHSVFFDEIYSHGYIGIFLLIIFIYYIVKRYLINTEIPL